MVEVLEQRICLSDGSTFVELIDNPFLPLIPGTTLIYRGFDAEAIPIRNRLNVTDLTSRIDGVTTTVVRERRYLDGELIEDSREYFAQDDSGNVWQFGRDRRQIDDGQVVGSDGSWRAGIDGAAAQIVMSAQPSVGTNYGPEEVRGLNERVKVPFATFGNCLKTEGSELKLYAPGIGCVMSQSQDDSAQTLRLAYVVLEPQAFADRIDNPYAPYTPGTTLIYRGADNGVPIRLRVTVTHDTHEITGVATTVVRERQYVDGELIEDTLDYFAQDKAGNVWLFGELSREIEDGRVVSTEGSWEAGADGATPGIFMRAAPSVGDFYRLENAPGIAEDRAEVLERGADVKVPYGSLKNVLVTQDSSELDAGDLELKYYAPGLGFVMEESADPEDNEFMRLAYVIVE